MRFLHTSDWHLGRTLHGVDLLDAQRDVLAQIVQLVSEPRDGIPVDAVIVAGDIYDRAVPPVEAIAVLSHTLAELTQHTTVILTAGNHDSAIRLGFGAELFTDRLQIRTDVASAGSPIKFGDVAVYPLPYLDPDVARVVLSSDENPIVRSHQAVMSAAMDRVRDNLATQPAGTRSLVIAHAFVVGGAPSESERSIVVGGVDGVASETFDGVDYVALGHLHGAQQLATRSTTVLRYSGSVLRYSFSERAHHKSVTFVDLDAAGSVTVTPMPLRQPRGMAELTGALDELLHEPAYAKHLEDWVRITVTDRARPEQLFDRVKSRFPHVLQVFHVPAGSLTPGAYPAASAVAQAPRTLAADFVQHVTGLSADEAELDLFDRAYSQALAEAGSA
jgi:exonuclease SbcD